MSKLHPDTSHQFPVCRADGLMAFGLVPERGAMNGFTPGPSLSADLEAAFQCEPLAARLTTDVSVGSLGLLLLPSCTVGDQGSPRVCAVTAFSPKLLSSPLL